MECQRYEYAQFPPIIGTDTDGRESASSPRETRDPISLHIDPPDRYARPINSYITSSLQQPHVDAGSIKWPASPSFTLLSPSQLSISPITPYHTPVYTRRQPFPTVSTATIIQLSIALEHGIGSKSDENQATYIYTYTLAPIYIYRDRDVRKRDGKNKRFEIGRNEYRVYNFLSVIRRDRERGRSVVGRAACVRAVVISRQKK